MLKKIERYEVLEELGHGGMATVYRARDTKLDRLIALKVMHPHLRGAKEARARFRREAQSVARLGHPRILEVYDYSGEDSDESYIATQLLTGPTLRVWADQHAPVPAEIAACIGIDVASALQAAHEKGIVHRDVKPENILLHENAKVVLTDFGIAGMVDSQSMTATGQILGSPGHMAPEQIEGDHTDARTDVFALGTVIYFLATGRLPFTGRNPHQILKRIVDGEYPDPLRIEPRVGGQLKAILSCALEKKPEDRYPSAKALEDELRAFVGKIGIDDPSAEIARYFASPEEQAKAIHQRVVERYIALGKDAKAEGKIPVASDCFSRALAIDDGNAEVLALVSEIGRAQSTPPPRRMGPAALAIATVLLASGALTWHYTFGAEPDPDVELVAVTDLDAGTSDAGAPLPVDAALPADVPEDVAHDGGTDAREPEVASGRRVTPVTYPPRRVAFVIDPANVTVAIDGGAPRSLVGLANGVELSVGVHQVFVDSQTDCCRDEDFRVEVEPGEGTQEVSLRLPPRETSLFVRGPPGSTVLVGNGRARGRSLEIIAVPMRARDEELRVEVSAPGYLPHTEEVDFHAGDSEGVQLTVELVPEPAEPPEE